MIIVVHSLIFRIQQRVRMHVFAPVFRRLMSTVSSTKISTVTLIHLNRPERVNALDLSTLRNLVECINHFESDNESSCAVLCGQGGNFCSGFDLHELSQNPESNIHLNFREFLRRSSKKPIIAAVNGYAVGQGLDLALWCDLRYVEGNALMGFYNRRFSIPTVDVTIRRLKKMIGTSRTMEMLLHGNHITTREALDWGICNKMVSPGTAIGEAVHEGIKLSQLCQESLLTDRATLFQQSHSNILEDKCKLEQNTNTKELPTEKSRRMIERFIKKEFGQHGSFKNVETQDSLDFLHGCKQ